MARRPTALTIRMNLVDYMTDNSLEGDMKLDELIDRLDESIVKESIEARKKPRTKATVKREPGTAANTPESPPKG